MIISVTSSKKTQLFAFVEILYCFLVFYFDSFYNYCFLQCVYFGCTLHYFLYLLHTILNIFSVLASRCVKCPVLSKNLLLHCFCLVLDGRLAASRLTCYLSFCSISDQQTFTLSLRMAMPFSSFYNLYITGIVKVKVVIGAYIYNMILTEVCS